MRYQFMDVLELPEDWAGFYDVVIDKALMDSMLCAKDGKPQVSRMLKHLSKVLKPGTGVYVCISGGLPDKRKPLLLGAQQHGDISEEFGWKVDCDRIPKPTEGKIIQS